MKNRKKLAKEPSKEREMI